MANGEVIIDVNADTSKYEDKVKGLGGKTESMMKKAEGASFGLLGAVTAAAAGVAVVGAASVGAAEEAAAANKRLDQIYSQMGDSTGKLSQAAKDYADELSKQIGIDDEIIKAGQAKLATFSNVSSSATTMARATKAAADLSAAGFGDISSTSVQLGKALQDPIKGMTALGKSGVTFSEQEKELIKQMYETGDVAGYQEIMFAAVEKQVGGVSEATATMGDKMGVQLGEIQESLGQAFLPIAEAILPLIEQLATKIGEFFDGDWQGKLKELAPAFTVVGGAILVGIVPALVAMAAAAWAAVAPLIPFLAIGAALGAAVWLVVDALGGWSNALAALKSAWSTVWGYISPLVNTIKTFIVGTFNTITSAISNNMGLIQATIQRVMKAIQASWAAAWGIIKAVIPPLWNAIKAVVSGVLGGIGGIIKTIMQLITGDWKGAWETIKNTVKNTWDSLVTIVTNLGKAVIDGLVAGIKGAGARVYGALKSVVDTAVKGVKSLLGIKSPSKVFQEIGKNINEGFVIGIDSTAKNVKSSIDKVVETIISKMKSLSKGANDSTKAAITEMGMRSIEYIRGADNALIALVGTKEKLASKINDAKKSLADLKKEAEDFAKAVSGGISASVSNMFKEGTTAQDFAQSLKDRFAAAVKFKDDMNLLKAKGLSSDLLMQIAGMGLDSGAGVASELASASVVIISEINKTNSDIMALAEHTGASLADAMYGAGIDSMRGIVKGLQKEQGSVYDAIKRIADMMVQTIKSELKISSPSRVFEDIGMMIGKGLEVGGVTSMTAAGKKILDALPSAPQIGGATMAMAGTGLGSSGSVVNYTQNIYTPVTSYGETKRAQREMGMTLAGRLV